MGAEQQYLEWAVRVPSAELGERAAAELFAAGAAALEELDEGRTLRVFAPASAAAELEAALLALAPAGVAAGAAEPVESVDWSTAWREGLEAVAIGDQLVVRPPFVEDPGGPPSLVIEPGQAFGTGGHATTRLALELLVSEPLDGLRVLDVGTGSGVLALAALRLGADHAVGLDLDPLAAEAATDNARRNRLERGLRLLTGPLGALAAPGFDCVVANMIRSELEPILGALCAACAPNGRLILSGLLRQEEGSLRSSLHALGFRIEALRNECDERDDDWLAASCVPREPKA